MPVAVSAACKDPVALWYVYNIVAGSYRDRCLSILPLSW